jgi:hypothetical protein
MRITPTTLLLSFVLAAGGCCGASAGQYLNRTDTITTSAGDDQDVNAALQIIDPWPRHAGNRHIPGNGERLSGAVQRYRSPSQLAGAPGMAGVSGPSGASGSSGSATPPPPTPSSGAATPPATLPF